MTKARPIRCDDKVYDLFRMICKEEGRTQNKVLEMLVLEYLSKTKKISKGKIFVLNKKGLDGKRLTCIVNKDVVDVNQINCKIIETGENVILTYHDFYVTLD